MMYLFSYDDVKRLNDERRGRSAARYQIARMRRETGTARRPTREAEVFELIFTEDCEMSERLGA